LSEKRLTKYFVKLQHTCKENADEMGGGHHKRLDGEVQVGCRREHVHHPGRGEVHRRPEVSHEQDGGGGDGVDVR